MSLSIQVNCNVPHTVLLTTAECCYFKHCVSVVDQKNKYSPETQSLIKWKVSFSFHRFFFYYHYLLSAEKVYTHISQIFLHPDSLLLQFQSLIIPTSRHLKMV